MKYSKRAMNKLINFQKIPYHDCFRYAYPTVQIYLNKKKTFLIIIYLKKWVQHYGISEPVTFFLFSD